MSHKRLKTIKHQQFRCILISSLEYVEQFELPKDRFSRLDDGEFRGYFASDNCYTVRGEESDQEASFAPPPNALVSGRHIDNWDHVSYLSKIQITMVKFKLGQLFTAVKIIMLR